MLKRGMRRDEDDDSVPNLRFFFLVFCLSVYMKKLYSKKKRKEIGSARFVLHHKRSVHAHTGCTCGPEVDFL